MFSITKKIPNIIFFSGLLFILISSLSSALGFQRPREVAFSLAYLSFSLATLTYLYSLKKG
jgi:hypothetical protein